MRKMDKKMSDFIRLEITLDIIKKAKTILDKKDIDSEDIAFFRNDIRKNIFFLKEEFLDSYSDTICKYMIFPLLACVDEKMMLIQESNSTNISWSLLQLEYYDRRDGGEYVFEIMDNLLSDTIYPDVCYKILYLILDNGFLGKYYDNIYNHDFLSYKKKMNKIINNLAVNDIEIIDTSKEVKALRKPNHYKRDFIKLSIPVILFTISIIIFIY